jgi:hypothetical protein
MIKKYLCIVIDSNTKRVLAEYQLTAMGACSAVAQAKLLFERDQRYIPSLRAYPNWCIDSCEID